MKLPNPKKIGESLNNKMKEKPKISLSIMCILLVISMVLLFGFSNKKDAPFSSLENMTKTNMAESGNQNFSISNLLKARDIKNDLEQLRANGLKTKADTMKMLKIINQFNEIDPSLKKDFEKKIIEEEKMIEQEKQEQQNK